MCDRQEIQYNFQQALTQADKLDDVADCLRRISENSMEESMKTLTSAWNGESAIVFLEKEDLLKNNIKSCVEAVNICFTKSSSLVAIPVIPFPPLFWLLYVSTGILFIYPK